MKLLIIIFLLPVMVGCKDKFVYDGENLAVPHYYRKYIGYDSIQLTLGGRARYNEKKKDFDVTWDSITANFCYPNQWEGAEFNRDTVFIHDTVYIHDNIIQNKGTGQQHNNTGSGTQVINN